MEGFRFDAWTRRQFGLTIGGGVAALLGLRELMDAEAKKKKKGKRRGKKKDKNKKQCKDVTEGCKGGQSGNLKGNCCGDLICGDVEGSDEKRCCINGGESCPGNDNNECCGSQECIDGECQLIPIPA